MPNRIVREGIISSPRINKLSPGAELFYRRLLSVVDDFGRFHGSPATLRAACWPTCPERACEQDVSNWLAECAQSESNLKALLTQYESNGAKYVEVVDFRQPTRSKSKFPQPEIILHADCAQNDCVVRSSYSVVRSAECDVREAPPKLPKAKPEPMVSKELELFEEAWERHRNYSPKEPHDHVLRMIISKPPDWERFSARHGPWCDYWEKKGWNAYGSLTLLGWIQANMPEPPIPTINGRASPPPKQSSGAAVAYTLPTDQELREWYTAEEILEAYRETGNPERWLAYEKAFPELAGRWVKGELNGTA